MVTVTGMVTGMAKFTVMVIVVFSVTVRDVSVTATDTGMVTFTVTVPVMGIGGLK